MRAGRKRAAFSNAIGLGSPQLFCSARALPQRRCPFDIREAPRLEEQLTNRHSVIPRPAFKGRGEGQEVERGAARHVDSLHVMRLLQLGPLEQLPHDAVVDSVQAGVVERRATTSHTEAFFAHWGMLHRVQVAVFDSDCQLRVRPDVLVEDGANIFVGELASFLGGPSGRVSLRAVGHPTSPRERSPRLPEQPIRLRVCRKASMHYRSRWCKVREDLV
mmetsp:Transcript_36357/g.95275  ORF Transcript_36357/g.95275 Transcript_36357/m.95275 type:complete len:218 (+) Transcript_36357:880-1533(+)